ncbi:unnamed protein product [Calicophoron daubneyi]|uniref:Fanconi anemia group I protein n=1 Tax=Calicophoron daubneyi TaxID=300641 RepID=A0AAV2TGZ4_CALDB
MERALLLNAENPSRVREIIRNKKSLEVIEVFRNILLNAESDENVIILEALICGTYENEELLDICEGVVDTLWSVVLPDRFHSIMSTYVTNSVEYLEDWKLERLCFKIVQNLKKQCIGKAVILDAFSKAMDKLETSGTAFNSLVKSLCNADWAAENTIPLLGLLSNYSLVRSSVKSILSKVLAKLDRFDCRILPDLLKSILIFSSPVLDLVLNNLQTYLNSNDRETSKLEDALLVAFVELCNQNDQFRSSFINVMKKFSGRSGLSDFVCAALLVVLPNTSLQSQALRTLSSYVLSGCSDNQLIQESCFLRGMCEIPPDPVQQITKLLSCCSLSWSCMNCSSSRDDIIGAIVNHLWSESCKPSAVQYADLLADLVALCPLEVAVFANRLDPVVDSLGLIPIELSAAIVHALLPLIRAGSKLLDAWEEDDQPLQNPIVQLRTRILTTLCKISSNARIRNRRTAVTCFLLLLKHLKVTVSAFRLAVRNSSSSSFSQHSTFSQSQSTQTNPSILYTQLQSTQVAQQAVTLPCDTSQNEALCTEIVSVLHRVIFSVFFRSQSGSFLEDPENRLKSDIYLGLCEVVARNKGLCETVLNLYIRCLIGIVRPDFLRHLKQTANTVLLTMPTVVEPSQPVTATGPVVSLDDLIKCTENGHFVRSEHPQILVWCLQLVLTHPLFASSWRRYRLSRSAEASNTSSESSQSSAGFSQFTQSAGSTTVACGRPVSSSLFSKAVALLIGISDSLRTTPLDDFGLTPDMDFGSSSTGKLNREKAQLLLGLYDACVEFELKDPLRGISATIEDNTEATKSTQDACWNRVRLLFARRLALRNLVYGKLPGLANSNIGHGNFLLSSGSSDGDSRAGLLILGVISAAQANLSRILRASVKSDVANSLAHHLLLTITSRLAQFTHCTGGGIPYAYRDGLIDAVVPILKDVIRYYNHMLLVEYDCNVTTNADSTESSHPRTGSTSNATTPSAALGVLEIAFVLALEFLGSNRLHQLAMRLYPAASNPNYRYPTSEADDDPNELEDLEQEEEYPERSQSEISPAQALSTMIKLIKGWITHLLAPPEVNPQTQHSSAHSANRTKDLVILLPVLVRLCRARAIVGAGDSSGSRSNSNPYAGLDRVLVWLLRLMRAPGKSTAETNALVSSARVQLVNQAIWLAHLVGDFADGDARAVTSLTTTSSDLSIECLLSTLAADIHISLGDTIDAKDGTDVSVGPENDVTFPLVNRSSSLLLLPLIYSAIRQLLTEFEWILNYLTSTLGGRLKLETLSDEVTTNEESSDQDNAHEEVLCRRLVGLGETLGHLFQTTLPAPSANADNLLETGFRVFNFLTSLVKYYLRIVRSRCGRFPVIFERVIRVFGKFVSPNAYSFIAYIQHAESEKVKAIQDKKPLKKDAKNSGKKEASQSALKKDLSNGSLAPALISRSIKESRLIPQLIYAIEQYERFLMQLSKRSKVNLMRNVKLAVSRDFRINQATVIAQQERCAALSVSSDSEDDGSDEANNQPVGGNGAAPSNERSSIVHGEDIENRTPVSTGYRPSVVDLVVPADSSQSQLQMNPLESAEIRTPEWGTRLPASAARRSALKRPLQSDREGLGRSPPVKLMSRNPPA